MMLAVLARKIGLGVVHYPTTSTGAADPAFAVTVGVGGGIVRRCCYRGVGQF